MEDRINLYTIVQAAGRGNYAIVYKAVRKIDSEVVAIKVISIREMSDSSARSKCLKEVQILQTLHHRNIISCLDTFVHEEHLVLVFEWAEAGDLKRQIVKAREKKARFSERIVWKYFTQICEGVRYMHSKRVMHRDLKPANLFLMSDASLKIGDLGLGRILSDSTLQVYSKVGTPLYMSPEVLKGKGYEFKSDIWSLGCVLYELCVLKSPFRDHSHNLLEIFRKINRAVYKPIPEFYSTVLRDLSSSMLTVDPDERPDIETITNLASRQFQHHEELKAARVSTISSDSNSLISTTSESSGEKSSDRVAESREPMIDNLTLGELCLNKLKVLNYEEAFCSKYHYPPITKEILAGIFEDKGFEVQMPIIYFSMCKWLLAQLDCPFEVRSNYFQNASNLLSLLPLIGLSQDVVSFLPPDALQLGYGRVAGAILNWILEQLFVKRGLPSLE